MLFKKVRKLKNFFIMNNKPDKEQILFMIGAERNRLITNKMLRKSG